jgi:16S rRNA pseudouridine516 synthase
MRLDKYLGNVTDLSRSQAKIAIKNGLVRVENRIVRDAAMQIKPQEQQVRLEGSILGPCGPRYFMLHKPQGYVCATTDRRHPTVLDLLDEPNLNKLHIAGRLDIDSSGLVLITDDGNWSHRVTSPKHHCIKRYQVELAEPLETETVSAFKNGILLESETRKTRPAELVIIDSYHAEVLIGEGRYHQVKRMFAAVGNFVKTLHRVSVGNIILDETLSPGEYRPLSTDEINSI